MLSRGKNGFKIIFLIYIKEIMPSHQYLDRYKEYQKQYYNNIQKEKLKNEFIFCDACNRSYAGWNIRKHYKSAKHLKNSLSEEEIKELKIQKEKNREERVLQKRIKKLEELVNLEKNGNKNELKEILSIVNINGDYQQNYTESEGK
jgi:hypothetical protein